MKVLDLLLSALAFCAPEKTMRFDIAPMPLADALLAFSQRSGCEFLITGSRIAPYQSPGFVGTGEPTEVLTALLRCSPYVGRIDDGVIRLRSVDDKEASCKEPVA